jgi:hypothetical protein
MESSATLQVDNIRIAALSLAVAVKRGAFAIEEVDEVSGCYKALKKFLDEWQLQGKDSKPGSTITEAEKTALKPTA